MPGSLAAGAVSIATIVTASRESMGSRSTLMDEAVKQPVQSDGQNGIPRHARKRQQYRKAHAAKNGP